MRSLITFLAKTVPFEILLGLLKDGIAEYDKDPTKENKQRIAMHVMMIGINVHTDGQDTMDVIKEWESSAQLINAFKAKQ